jgi:hypothetical protein
MEITALSHKMPLNLLALQDPPVELKSSVFEERRKDISFFLQPGFNGWAALAFNMSVSNTTSLANLSYSINGVEIQRYSLKDQPTSAINEIFPSWINLQATNTLSFEIVDTPLTEGAVVRISDVLLWVNTA